MTPTVHAIELYEDGAVTLMARLTFRSTGPGLDGTVLSSSDVSSIVEYVYDYSDPTTPVSVGSTNGTTLTTSTVFFGATLQGWHVDSKGHNFRSVVASTSFATGNTPYRIAHKVTMADSSVYQMVWQGVTEPIATSSS